MEWHDKSYAAFCLIVSDVLSSKQIGAFISECTIETGKNVYYLLFFFLFIFVLYFWTTLMVCEETALSKRVVRQRIVKIYKDFV